MEIKESNNTISPLSISDSFPKFLCSDSKWKMANAEDYFLSSNGIWMPITDDTYFLCNNGKWETNVVPIPPIPQTQKEFCNLTWQQISLLSQYITENNKIEECLHLLGLWKLCLDRISWGAPYQEYCQLVHIDNNGFHFLLDVGTLNGSYQRFNGPYSGSQLHSQVSSLQYNLQGHVSSDNFLNFIKPTTILCAAEAGLSNTMAITPLSNQKFFVPSASQYFGQIEDLPHEGDQFLWFTKQENRIFSYPYIIASKELTSNNELKVYFPIYSYYSRTKPDEGNNILVDWVGENLWGGDWNFNNSSYKRYPEPIPSNWVPDYLENVVLGIMAHIRVCFII